MLHLDLFSAIIPPVVQDSIRTLRARGYKVTKPRERVLEALEQAQKPISPYEIQELLRKRGKYLNHVTIYRILDLFCHLNLAHRVLSSGGFVRCALGEEEGCHRFMVCRQCGALREFADGELCREENEFAENFGFHTEYHLSEFSGICADCHGRRKWASG